jgi:hypothetical protein
MRHLLILGRFADDSQGVLAAVFGFASVGRKRLENLSICATKRRTATFTDGQQWIAANNAHFSGTHGNSLAPKGCENETAPVPEFQITGSGLTAHVPGSDSVEILPSFPNLCYYRPLKDIEGRQLESGDPTPVGRCLRRTDRRMVLGMAVPLEVTLPPGLREQRDFCFSYYRVFSFNAGG